MGVKHNVADLNVDEEVDQDSPKASHMEVSLNDTRPPVGDALGADRNGEAQAGQKPHCRNFLSFRTAPGGRLQQHADPS